MFLMANMTSQPDPNLPWEPHLMLLITFLQETYLNRSSVALAAFHPGDHALCPPCARPHTSPLAWNSLFLRFWLMKSSSFFDSGQMSFIPLSQF